MKEKVLNALKKVDDPELGINVVDLGIIYKVIALGSKAVIVMTATTPFCPYLPHLVKEVEKAAVSVRGIKEAKVNVVWSPPWDISRMSEGAKAELGVF